MDISLTTPSLLFPASSLLMLAYTNRFVVLANLVRRLHEEHLRQPSPVVRKEIENLRFRLRLIRGMQSTGVGSMLLCVVCMFVFLFELKSVAVVLFAFSLILLAWSLLLALLEIFRSTDALELHLSDLDRENR